MLLITWRAVLSCFLEILILSPVLPCADLSAVRRDVDEPHSVRDSCLLLWLAAGVGLTLDA